LGGYWKFLKSDLLRVVCYRKLRDPGRIFYRGCDNLIPPKQHIVFFKFWLKRGSHQYILGRTSAKTVSIKYTLKCLDDQQAYRCFTNGIHRTLHERPEAYLAILFAGLTCRWRLLSITFIKWSQQTSNCAVFLTCTPRSPS